MSSLRERKHMRVYNLTRRVSVGTLTIRLWIEASEGTCELCEEAADETALCAATLADEDDDPIVLADKLMSRLSGLTAVEVTNEQGNGGHVQTFHAMIEE